MRKISTFLKIVFLTDWHAFHVFISFLLPIIVFLFPSDVLQKLSLKWKIMLMIFLATFGFILKILKQFYKYYLSYLSPIKVIRKVQGDGMYTGSSIIVLENPGYLRDNTMLTLISESSGACQPICILKIIKSQRDEDMLAIQIIPSEDKYPIDKYFDEESRRKSLYALPLLNMEDMKNLQE